MDYQDTVTTVNKFFLENPEYKDLNFVQEYSSLESLIRDCPVNWWEDKYETWTPQEIADLWREHNNCRIIQFDGLWFLFTEVE